MSYGYGNSRRLRFIISKLQPYVIGLSGTRKLSARRSVAGTSLPPVLALSIMRGEAILRLRFMAYFDTLDMGLDNPEHLWTLWQKLIVERGRIHDLVNRIGLISVISSQTNLPSPDAELAYQLYCGLIDDLDRADEFALLEIGTDYFFRHAFLSLYPSKIPRKAAEKSPEGLRASVMGRLRKFFRRPFEIKESFRQEETSVEFHLKIKFDGRWHDLPTYVGKRLKSTRMDAYEHLLNDMKAGRFAEWVGSFSVRKTMVPQVEEIAA